MFNKLTVIAPGLLGASVAMAARQRQLAKNITIWARREETRNALSDEAWCDSAPDDLAAACADSDFIVLCAPVERIIDLAQLIAPGLNSNPIVTDVGSVKSQIAHLCSGALEGKGRFVGSHPMAGSEKTGMENGSSELFIDRHCFVTPLPETDEAAKHATLNFWRAIGCNVSEETPERHDEIVASSSHLPHVLAAALSRFIGAHCPTAAETCGNGLRDTTRVASGDPQLWYEIISQNRHELTRVISAFQDDLQGLSAAIANDDRFAIIQHLAEGKAFRDSLDK